MKRLCFAVALMFVLGCAHKPKAIESKASSLDQKDASGRPLWVTAPYDVCPDSEICAVGEGAGFLAAEAVARQELAKHFSTQIQARTVITTFDRTNSQGEGQWSGDSQEDLQQFLQEQTNELLKGVSIKARFEDKTTVYALASLDRYRAASLVKQEMDGLDERMLAGYKDGRRHKLFEALGLYYKREQLASRHQLLVGNAPAAPLTLAKLMEQIKVKEQQAVAVWLSFQDLPSKDETKHNLIKTLLDQDYRVVTDDGANHQFKVQGKLQASKEYMKVAGFERHKFSLQLASERTDGQKLGAFEFSTTQNGRNFEQAYERALPELTKYISEHLSELYID